MGSESVAHKAEWAINSEAMRVRGIIIVLVKIQLVGKKNIYILRQTSFTSYG